MKCGHPLGFLPDILDLATLETGPENGWHALAAPAGGVTYRRCANSRDFHACNWMVPAGDPQAFCAACRLNLVVPNLTDPKNLERWSKLELAKRRLLYTLFKLDLPVESPPGGGAPPLRFQFLQTVDSSAPVTTGHENGVITLNIAEADDDEREHRRVELHEPYRTLLGHLRHETGHYYWDRLIAGTSQLPRFRELFGDETADYTATMQTYYQQGPRAGWEERNVTAYASSHPWEDWAETWAHYQHITDAIETAASFGVSINPERPAGIPILPVAASPGRTMDFDRMLSDWVTLSCALNSFNRGLGLLDLYPFVIPPPVVEKLRFIHDLIHSRPA